MPNDAVYAAGLVNRALDPATQPPEIKEFLRAEYDALCQFVSGKLRVIDIGCGTGRHLLGLHNSLALGLGLDYERGYVVEASRRAPTNVHFVTADATAIPVRSTFDIAICVFNTWGTMSDKAGVLREMRRAAPKPGTRLLSVFSPASVRSRREWYRRLGHEVVAETSEYLESDGGFRSEHFTPERIRGLVGDCAIATLTPIAFAVTF